MMSTIKDYRVISKVGEGTFGEVFKAVHIQTGQIVALKKVRIRKLTEGIPTALLREIQALEQIQHQNVLALYEYFPSGSSVVIACELMTSDLYQIMKCLGSLGRRLQAVHVKTIMRMILEGLAAVHESKLIHRDLKPANILFAGNGQVKIGDFGLARVHNRDDAEYSHEVATRWYRAPELLFGSRFYGAAVDMWAVGCIFAELLQQFPLFPGEHDIDQLYKIFLLLGTPSEQDWPGLSQLPDYNKISFPTMQAAKLSMKFRNCDPQAIHLLQQLLIFNPEKRITASQALLDDYFFTEPYPEHFSKLKEFVRLPLHNDSWRAVYGQWDPTQPFDVVQHFNERMGHGINASLGMEEERDVVLDVKMNAALSSSSSTTTTATTENQSSSPSSSVTMPQKKTMVQQQQQQQLEREQKDDGAEFQLLRPHLVPSNPSSRSRRYSFDLNAKFQLIED